VPPPEDDRPLHGVSTTFSHVDRNDVARAEEPRAHDRREPDRAGTDDGDHVTGPDRAVEDADLVTRREDVSQRHRTPA